MNSWEIKLKLLFVNLISEKFTEKKDYNKAIECFDRAISIGKVKKNLRLFLNRKAITLFQLNEFEKSKICNDESYEIAKKINRKDIFFKSLILSSKLLASSDKVKSKEILEKMLKDFRDDSQVAAINYELYKLDGNKETRKKSLEVYSKLYEKSPDTHSSTNYKKIIEELST